MHNVSQEDDYRHGFIILFLFFTITRIIIHLIGVRFDITPLYWFYQFLDPQDLTADLSKSLMYLHIQPPGFNLFLGLVLKFASGFELLTFKIVYMVMGLVATLALYSILVRLKIPAILALFSCMFFAISPPVIFFENWLFYTYPVTLLVVVSCLVLHLYLEKHKWVFLFLFFIILTLIVITRSLFHPIWFIMILIWLIFFEKKNVKKILLCACFPLLIIAGLYIKNYVIFNQTSLTSWFGMNLIKMTFTVPVEKIRPLIDHDEISSIALVKPFRIPDAYRLYANFDTLTGTPVLDKKYKSTGFVNFNHIGYISVSKQYYSAARYLIWKYPNYYFHSVAKAFYAYLRPCSDSIIIRGRNRRKMSLWVSFYQEYLLGDVLNRIWRTNYVNRFGQERTVHINFLYFFIPILYTWGIIVSIKGQRLFGFQKSETLLLKYIMFNILYVTIIGNLIEISENMRFRFLILPLAYILAVTMIAFLIGKTRQT